jgi:hypothetical protein
MPSAEKRVETSRKRVRAYIAEQRYEDALAEVVWFHENALRFDESYYGVRLSFALRDWMQLGKDYPPALEKLRAIRDEKEGELRAGERKRDTFHDVEAINRHLNEVGRTATLFKELAAVILILRVLAPELRKRHWSLPENFKCVRST